MEIVQVRLRGDGVEVVPVAGPPRLVRFAGVESATLWEDGHMSLLAAGQKYHLQEGTSGLPEVRAALRGALGPRYSEPVVEEAPAVVQVAAPGARISAPAARTRGEVRPAVYVPVRPDKIEPIVLPPIVARKPQDVFDSRSEAPPPAEVQLPREGEEAEGLQNEVPEDLAAEDAAEDADEAAEGAPAPPEGTSWSELGLGLGGIGAVLLLGAGFFTMLVPLMTLGLALLLLGSLAVLDALPRDWRGLVLVLALGAAAYVAWPALDAFTAPQETRPAVVARKSLRTAWPPFRVGLNGDPVDYAVGYDAYTLAVERRPCVVTIGKGERPFLVWLRRGAL